MHRAIQEPAKNSPVWAAVSPSEHAVCGLLLRLPKSSVSRQGRGLPPCRARREVSPYPISSAQRLPPACGRQGKQARGQNSQERRQEGRQPPCATSTLGAGLSPRAEPERRSRGVCFIQADASTLLGMTTAFSGVAAVSRRSGVAAIFNYRARMVALPQEGAPDAPGTERRPQDDPEDGAGVR